MSSSKIVMWTCGLVNQMTPLNSSGWIMRYKKHYEPSRHYRVAESACAVGHTPGNSIKVCRGTRIRMSAITARHWPFILRRPVDRSRPRVSTTSSWTYTYLSRSLFISNTLKSPGIQRFSCNKRTPQPDESDAAR